MTTSHRSSPDLRHRVEHMLGDLDTMRGESRLQRHLLAMELRDRLDDLERRHADLHAAVRQAGADAIESLSHSIAELRESFRVLRGHAASMTAPPDPKPAKLYEN